MAAASAIADWLKFIFLQVYNNAVLLATRPALNFQPPLIATDNSGSNRIDVTLNSSGAVYPSIVKTTFTVPDSPGVQIVRFDASGGSFTITMPVNSADGMNIIFLDVGDATSPTNVVTFADSHVYRMQDPDTMALGNSYQLKAVRNLAFIRATGDTGMTAGIQWRIQ